MMAASPGKLKVAEPAAELSPVVSAATFTTGEIDATLPPASA